MLEHAHGSMVQTDELIYSLQIQFQNLIKLEVTDRQTKDMEDIEESKDKFKIPFRMQMEELMKKSKSIADKTKADLEKEKQAELDEIKQNFPTFEEEFERDRLFVNADEAQEIEDYEKPKDERYSFFIQDSFANDKEKKK